MKRMIGVFYYRLRFTQFCQYFHREPLHPHGDIELNLPKMTGIDVLRVFLHSHSRQQSLTEYHEAFHRILYADRHTKAIMEYALGALFGLKDIRKYSPEVEEFVEALTTALHHCKEEFDGKCVSRMLFGLQRLNASHGVVRGLLREIVQKTYLNLPHEPRDNFSVDNGCNIRDNVVTEMHMTNWEFSHGLSGLQRMSARHFEVQSLLDAVATRLPPLSQGTHDAMPSYGYPSAGSILSAMDIAYTLHGLRSMHSSHESVRRFLRNVVIPLLSNVHNTHFTPSAVTRCVYSLQGLNSTHSEVRELLSVLATKIASSTSQQHPVTARQLEDILYGLQSLSSDHTEVLLLVSNLLPYIHNCEEKLSFAQWSRGLFGLKGMHTREPVVVALLQALIPKFQGVIGEPGQKLGFSSKITPWDVSRALNGMRRMRHTVSEVSLLMKAVARHTRECRGEVKGSDLAYSVRALKGMSSKDVDVRDLANSLSTSFGALPMADASMTSAHIAVAMRGLVTLYSEGREVQQMLLLIASKAESIAAYGEVWSGDQLSSAMYGLKNMNNEHEGVSQLLTTIIPFIKTSSSAKYGATSGSFDMTIKQLCTCVYGLKNMSNVTTSTHVGENRVNEVMGLLLTRMGKVVHQTHEHKSEFGVRSEKETSLGNTQFIQIEPEDVANMCYGLQRMYVGTRRNESLQPQPSEVLLIAELIADIYIRSLETEITEKISDRDQRWTAGALQKCFVGLQNVDFNSSRILRKLLRRLIFEAQLLIDQCCGNIDSMSDDEYRDVINLNQSLLMFSCSKSMLYGLSQDLRSALIRLLSSSMCLRPPPVLHLASKTAYRYRDILTTLTKQYDTTDSLYSREGPLRNVQSFHGVYLHGFYADIVLVGYHDARNKGYLDRSRDREVYYSPDPLQDPCISSISSDEGQESGLAEKGQRPLESCYSRNHYQCSPDFIDFIQSKGCRRLVVVNFEIDGGQKDLTSARGYCDARDKYLTTMHNVIVKRIQLSDIHKIVPRDRFIEEIDLIVETR